MNWTSLIIGLIIGWAIEWVIDWLYWRRRSTAGTGELENLQAQNRRLRADLDTANSTTAKLRADTGSLEASLNAAKSEAARLRAEFEARNDSAGQHTVALEALNAKLATAERENERLHAQLNVNSGVTANLNDQIGQLQAQLAAQAERPQLRTLSDGGEALAVGGSAPARDQFKTQLFSAADLKLAENVGEAQAVGGSAPTRDQFKTQLFSAADLKLAEDTGDELARLRGDLSGANGEIERLRAELAALRSRPMRDALIDINGIGPVIERRMHEAGIFTFEQLAAQAPERLREIARLQDWQDADPNAWIAEARERAAGKGQG